MDIDKCLETLKNGRYLSEREVFWVCVKIQEILSEDSNVINIKAPVKICGNINGHFLDLLELFRQGGQIPEENYIFMGGFVNRGQNSVETIEYLLCLILKYLKVTKRFIITINITKMLLYFFNTQDDFLYKNTNLIKK